MCSICLAKISACYSFVCHLWVGIREVHIHLCSVLDSLFRLFANYAIFNIGMVKINKFKLIPFIKHSQVWHSILRIYVNGCMNNVCGFSEAVWC